MMVYFAALVCVVGLAIGQIFFKMSANALSSAGTFVDLKVIGWLFAAMVLYATTSITWVWVLKHVELSRVYPLMALGFVLVPLGSYVVFNEKLTLQYGLGVLLITAGIIAAVRS